MIIRECRETDLPHLEQQMPSRGLNRDHEARFRRHGQGLSTFLVAELDDVPIGSGEVLWQGCGAPEVRERFPGCPELNGLTVAERCQSHGVGSALIRAAEAIAAENGRDLLGLGVDDHNPRAAALYLRLGYEETDCHYLDRYDYTDAQGERHEAADPCRFLIKPLPRR
jgi:ribosomal protein S18 acetylase RimI-like enzyme